MGRENDQRCLVQPVRSRSLLRPSRDLYTNKTRPPLTGRFEHDYSSCTSILSLPFPPCPLPSSPPLLPACRGRQGLVAYAAHNTVVVIDPRSIQPLQTLSAHKTNVIKLRWSTECHHHTLASPYSLRLASVDTTSHCIVWDVNQGAVSAEFSLGTKPLVDLQWLHTNVG